VVGKDDERAAVSGEKVAVSAVSASCRALSPCLTAMSAMTSATHPMASMMDKACFMWNKFVPQRHGVFRPMDIEKFARSWQGHPRKVTKT